MNPVNPGLSCLKLDRARDANFWSVRVSSDTCLVHPSRPDGLAQQAGQAEPC